MRIACRQVREGHIEELSVPQCGLHELQPSELVVQEWAEGSGGDEDGGVDQADRHHADAQRVGRSAPRRLEQRAGYRVGG